MSRAGVSGIVLAGGRSTRFGEDKLAVEVDGRPLLHRAVGVVAGVVDEVVIVVGAGRPEPSLPADLRVPVVVAHDAVAGLGPLAGLAAGLAVASHPHALLVGGDQPSLQPDVLRALLDGLAGDSATTPVDVMALEDGDRLWPFPVALRVATVRPAVEAALAGSDLRLFTLFKQLRVARVPASLWRALDPAGASLFDVDRRGDLPPPVDLPPP